MFRKSLYAESPKIVNQNKKTKERKKNDNS
jgi:hypothetical protein